MKQRKIILYTFLITLIIGSAPYFTGYLVHTKFQDLVKVASEFDSMNVEIIEYKRGWRKSFAKTKVSLKGKYLQKLIDAIEQSQPQAAIGPRKNVLHITLEHEIRHGPFVQLQDKNFKDWVFALATFNTQLFLTEEAKKVLITELGDTNFFNMQSEISITGGFKGILDGNPIKLKHDGRELVIWKGVHGEWELGKNLKHLQAEIVNPGFDFDWENKHYYGDDIVIKMLRHQNENGLWIGQTTVSAQKINIADPLKQMEWQAVNMGFLLESQKGLMQYSVDANIAKVIYSGKSFEPFHVLMSLKNIEPQVAKAFMENFQKYPLGTLTEQAGYLQNMLALIPQILKTRPELLIDELNIGTPQGAVQGAMHIAMGGPEITQWFNPIQMLQSLDGQAKLIVPKLFLREMLTAHYLERARNNQFSQIHTETKLKTEAELNTQVPQEVDSLLMLYVSNGYLIEDGMNYVINISAAHGELALNGKAVMNPAIGMGH